MKSINQEGRMKRGAIWIALPLMLTIAIPARAGSSNQSFTVQGVLRDGAGNLQSLPVGMQVNVYAAANSATALHSQTFVTVPVDSGFFSLELSGATLSFAAMSDAWIGVQVSGDPAELPRQHVTAVPYSFSASSADALSPACAGCVDDAMISGVGAAKISGKVALCAAADSAMNAMNAANATKAASATSAASAASADALSSVCATNQCVGDVDIKSVSGAKVSGAVASATSAATADALSSACATSQCVSDADIKSVSGAKVSGAVASAMTAATLTGLSKSCPAGQFIASVAPDGATTCGAALQPGAAQGFATGLVRNSGAAPNQIAHITVTPPAASGVLVATASYSISVANAAAACTVNTQLSTTAGSVNQGAPGFNRYLFPSSFNTAAGGGAYSEWEGMNVATFAVTSTAPVTIYLNGTFSCSDALWSNPNLQVSYLPTALAATFAAP
jgi:hypothetical protein